MAILNNSNAISTAGGYDINNSLRFRSSASAYLNRTPASTTNRQTWTWSGWVKRGTLGARQHIFVSANPVVNTLGQQEFQFCFDSSDRIEITGGTSGVGQDLNLTTTQVFRDPSSWYHLIVAIDTTQATSSNRMKFYVNGVQVTTFTTAIYPAQNHNTSVNLTGFSHRIGGSGGSYLDAYQAEIHLVDGQALTPSSFGETDTTTGSWKPKAYTGTYGTNGFYLKFSDIATTSGSNAGLGKDFSGNTNYWTTNNISVTAGTTYDAMIDSPTLTSATVANYCTLNPILEDGWWAAPNRATFQCANLRISQQNASGFSTFDVNSNDKWYFEITSTANQGSPYPSSITISAKARTTFEISYLANGQKVVNGSASSYGSSWTNGDTIGIAIDRANNQITFYKNNVSQGAITNTFPAIGVTVLGGYYSENTAVDTVDFNFGQRPFSYTPPTGFVRLNTYNLPDSTIKKGNTVMDATLYTGTGSSQSITNAASFKPDFVWIKNRTHNDADPYYGVHLLFNSTTGVGNRLMSQSTAIEAFSSQSLTAFNSNGFAIGTDVSVGYSGDAFVGWQWKANGGTTSSNTSGSITSTVQTNATAGFSVVTYTGTGANATVGHGLGVAPRMIIIKRRNGVTDWATYHASVGNTKALFLNRDIAADTGVSYWNNTSPTSTLFTVGTGADVNPSSGTMVVYCWAEIAGFSKFGSYVGNGSADGPFIYTGFRPKYVLIKRTDAVASWEVIDTARDPYNASANYLYPNLSDAEVNAPSNTRDYLSNGFKIRHAGGGSNASGGTYIYMAFAENPFKNSLAR